MTCPRCETNIPEDALYCPYCSLPKPKVVATPEEGIAEEANAAAGGEEAPAEAASMPSGAPVSPSGSVYASATKRRRSPPRPQKKARESSRSFLRKPKEPAGPGKKRFLIGMAAGLLAMGGAGFYTFVMPMMNAAGPEPKTALLMLDTLRKMPAREGGLTVDARLNQEIEKSKRVGNLLRFQGWRMKSVPGTTSQFLLVFSYEETDQSMHTAEWLVDTNTNSFIPQNDLARMVYGS